MEVTNCCDWVLAKYKMSSTRNNLLSSRCWSKTGSALTYMRFRSSAALLGCPGDLTFLSEINQHKNTVHYPAYVPAFGTIFLWTFLVFLLTWPKRLALCSCSRCFWAVFKMQYRRAESIYTDYTYIYVLTYTHRESNPVTERHGTTRDDRWGGLIFLFSHFDWAPSVACHFIENEHVHCAV